MILERSAAFVKAASCPDPIRELTPRAIQRGAEPGSALPPVRGRGLGLFIVGEITRAHGGVIAVSHTAEDETKFTVRLPLVNATAALAECA